MYPNAWYYMVLHGTAWYYMRCAPVGDSDLCRTIRVPVDRRRRPFDSVDRVRVAENGQALRARRFAGVVHFVAIEILLSPSHHHTKRQSDINTVRHVIVSAVSIDAVCCGTVGY